jgi:replication factor A1
MILTEMGELTIEQIDLLKEGATLVVRNASADVFNGFMRLNVNVWGKISTHPDGVASTPDAPAKVNSDNNLSAVEYELVTVEEAGDE